MAVTTWRAASFFVLGGRSTVHSNIQKHSFLRLASYNRDAPHALYLLPELVADLNRWRRLLKLKLLHLLSIPVNNV
jgi:hypothetical protein